MKAALTPPPHALHSRSVQPLDYSHVIVAKVRAATMAYVLFVCMAGGTFFFAPPRIASAQAFAALAAFRCIAV